MLQDITEDVEGEIILHIDGRALLNLALSSKVLYKRYSKEEKLREVCKLWNLPYYLKSLSFISEYYDSFFYTERTLRNRIYVALLRSRDFYRLRSEHYELYQVRKREYLEELREQEMSPRENELVLLKKMLRIEEDFSVEYSSTYSRCDPVFHQYLHKECRIDDSVLSFSMSPEKTREILEKTQFEAFRVQFTRIDNIDSLKVYLEYASRESTLWYYEKLSDVIQDSTKYASLECFLYVMEVIRELHKEKNNSGTRLLLYSSYSIVRLSKDIIMNRLLDKFFPLSFLERISLKTYNLCLGWTTKNLLELNV